MGHGASGSRLIPGYLHKPAPVVFRIERCNRRGEQRLRWNTNKGIGNSITVNRSPLIRHTGDAISPTSAELWDKSTSQVGKASSHNYSWP